MTPGIYHLIIFLSEDKIIKIGKFGTFHFLKGFYVYTGSAMGGVESRLARHCRKNKRLHWHIDYLLLHSEIIKIIIYPTRERLECELNQKILSLPDCKILIMGFGSSDCNCISHLAYFQLYPDLI